MALVTLEEILKESVAKRYAVGAFNAMEHGFAEAIIQSAEEKGVPVILPIFEGMYGIVDMDTYMPYIVDRIRRSSVPICLHLDHGASYEMCVKAIHYGCSSVMIDGSSLPYNENVALVKRVVEVAHACGVSVEAELGHVAGGEGDLRGGSEVDTSLYTSPEEAVKFIEETNIDALAVAIGTVHGVFRGTPQIDFQRLREIREAVDIPLVLHGGSGLTDDDFRNVVKYGVNKINFFTEVSTAAVEAVKAELDKREGFAHYHQLTVAGLKTTKEVVKRQIGIFGTQPLDS